METVLDRVNGPEDLNNLSDGEMLSLADDVRRLIIDTVSRNGGHLAANLGVVELTIALLKVFNPPKDKIIWDVSHQSYAYKILTGRKDKFSTLRQMGGISGFIKRGESGYDVYGAGHSGTAMSAALGMVVARDRRGSDERIVAVVGDGSIGCGISLEALNNVAAATKRFIVVLNDNEMSIAANVGSISSYLGAKLASPQYNRAKKAIERTAQKMHMGWLRKIYYRVEEAIKGLFLRSMVFEEFGLRYIGPIDGHNIHAVVDALTIARESDRPIILHISTQKGRGYEFAEKHPEKWHGATPFDVATGTPLTAASGVSYSGIFGETIVEMAEKNDKIIAITAAMPAGTGLSEFAKRFPDRFFDVGISEEHAAIFAAGLAAAGLVPVFAVYSTFAQRSVDCVIHDICLQGLPVVLCLDRAGIVGDDGPTHHGVFDIALFRPVPGVVIMQPADAEELKQMLRLALDHDGPVIIRYSRGVAPVKITGKSTPVEIGKAQVIDEPGGNLSAGKKVWLWALGDMIQVALEAAKILRGLGFSAGVVNARFVKPLDKELLDEQMKEAFLIATLENGVVSGGFGTGVQEYLCSKDYSGLVRRFGWPDEFVPQGSNEALMDKFGLTGGKIANAIDLAIKNSSK